jgi:hypothetical protein
VTPDEGSAGVSAASLHRLLTAALSRSGDDSSDLPEAGSGDAALSVSDRCALIGAVVEELAGRGDLDQSSDDPPTPAASYFDDDHRWAGWRADDPPAVPEASSFGRDEVLRALRRLPPAMRLALVAHDAAGIPVDDLHQVLAGTVDQQIVFVDAARRAYVTALAAEAAGGP